MGASVDNKPTAAFALVLVGGILILIGGIATMAIGSLFGLVNFGVGVMAGLSGILALILGIILVVAAVEMNTTDVSKVRTWSIVALILAIISLLDAGGFFIGFLLALIGSILGLTYKG